MIEKLLQRLGARDRLSAEEEQALRAAMGEVKQVEAGKTIIRGGVDLTESTLLLEGFLCRYKDRRDGARQITQLHVPGDFVDLHSFTLKGLDHDVMAISRSRVAAFPHERLEQLTAEYPHLTRLLWFATNVDAACHREWELSLGRRRAPERIAHLFCELYFRLRTVDLTTDFAFDFPFTQQQLSEAKGLTAVHVNRSLKQLRERGLVTFRGKRVVINDLQALMDLAEFDPGYLYLDRRRM